MGLFTKRIDSNVRDIKDSFTSGSWTASDAFADFYGFLAGDKDGVSFRFTGISVPQGATINSAKITFRANSTKSPTIALIINGVAEDNTAEQTSSPIDDARTRAHTSASVSWNATVNETNGSDFDSPDISSIIQEIVNRSGWASGNALGISIQDNGSASGNYLSVQEFQDNSAQAALLTIDYTGSSPSASLSPSASQSPSSSASASKSPSSSNSPSISPSPPPTPFHGMLKIGKPGINVLTNNDVEKFIFNSDYGTLKYFTKQQINISFDASTGDISAQGSYTHNLGYYPFCEVYVSVNGAAYEYVPFFGSGASIFYSANFYITTTQIKVFGEISGVSTATWTFNFLVFIYKNDLHLS